MKMGISDFKCCVTSWRLSLKMAFKKEVIHWFWFLFYYFIEHSDWFTGLFNSIWKWGQTTKEKTISSVFKARLLPIIPKEALYQKCAARLSCFFKWHIKLLYPSQLQQSKISLKISFPVWISLFHLKLFLPI